MRDEIESLIKDLKLDREKIFEVSKLEYKAIIRKVEKTFVNKNGDLHWSNVERGYKDKYSKVFKDMRENNQWYRTLEKIIPNTEEIVYVLLQDAKSGRPKYWVYEMCVPELIAVLDNVHYRDLYIVSKKYRWLITENHHLGVLFIGDGLKL